MKTDFVIALTQLAAERNLPKEVIIKTLEAALVPIFKRTSFAPDQEVSVKILPQTGEVKVFAEKLVVKRTTDHRQEITLAQAKKVKPDVQLGDRIEVEYTPADAGRIAAQTAKQVILQRLREAERDAIFGEYADKEGDIVSGIVHVVEPKQIVIDIGRTEAILPAAEQVSTEHYRVGQRLKVYLMKVLRTVKGTQLVVSRTHQNLLRRLFELEVPEINAGTVELKALAREPGYRSKVSVAARQEGVDAIGCCLGLRSIRIQNIIKELNGEKIDVIQWDPDPAVYIASALSPASVVKVEVQPEEKGAEVVVPDRQLSLAIGKGGQNARLAARLTGWRIDIKSVSMAEAGKAPVQELAEASVPVEMEERPEPEPAPVAGLVADPEMAVETPAIEAEIEAPAAVETPAEPEPSEPEAVPVEASAAAKPEKPAAVPAEPVEIGPKTYSMEELMSEIELATERIQRRFGGATVAPKVEPRIRKGKKTGTTEEAPAKPKTKKVPKRQRSEDEDLLDDSPDEEIELGGGYEEDE